MDALVEFLKANALWVPAIVGLIGVLWRIQATNAKDVRLQRLQRIDDVNKSYIEFQRLCLENSDIPASVYNGPSLGGVQAPEVRAKLALMFDILTSIFERAYLAVEKDGPVDQKSSQWPGWKLFMEEYASRPDYRSWWIENVAQQSSKESPQYDAGFQQFMNDLVSAAGTVGAGKSKKISMTSMFRSLGPRGQSYDRAPRLPAS